MNSIRLLGNMLFARTRNLSEEIRKSIFCLSAYITDIYRNECKNQKLKSLKMKMLDKAFQERDFALWELAVLKI
jgi:hypothetical protein